MIEQYISSKRIEARIDALAQIGGLPGGGMRRLPLSPEDRAARELLMRWMDDAGLAVRVDGGGNVIGRREGAQADLPVVMVGSHLDTQPTGGRYDGIAGVVTAMEVAQVMHETGFVNRHPIEIVDWACEEAAGRFDLSHPGSRAMVGELKPHELEMKCRLTGMTLGDALKSVGADVSKLSDAERRPGTVKAVVELHVEQGPFLERANKQIGVVSAIKVSKRLYCTILGQQAHAGGMPMEGRQDALCGAAEVLLAVESVAKSHSDLNVTGTVGYLTHEPQSIVIISGVATLAMDIRSVESSIAEATIAEIKDLAQQIADRRGLTIRWGRYWEQPAVKLSTEIADIIAQSCEELGISYQRMVSGAGHDTQNLARRFPAAMLFVPSVGGISHAPEEYTRTEDLVAGAKVLCRTVSKLAQ